MQTKQSICRRLSKKELARVRKSMRAVHGKHRED